MEEELGIALVDHDSRAVRLTEFGEFAAGEFKRICRSYEAVARHADEVAKGLSGRLSVGVPYFATKRFAVPLFKLFSERFPSIELESSSGQPDQLHDELLEGRIDIAINMFCGQMAVPDTDLLEVTEAFSEPQVLLCPAAHPLAASGELGPEDFEGQHMLWYESGALSGAFAQAVRSFFEQHGVWVAWDGAVRNADLIEDFVLESGLGIIVPGHAAAYNAGLASVELPWLFRSKLAIYTLSGNRNPSIALFRGIASRLSRI